MKILNQLRVCPSCLKDLKVTRIQGSHPRNEAIEQECEEGCFEHTYACSHHIIRVKISDHMHQEFMFLEGDSKAPEILNEVLHSIPLRRRHLMALEA